MATYTEGYRKEIPDQTPVELPVGYKVPETLEQLIARLVNNKVNQDYLASQGAETFEEADDFDVDDDIEMSSPYEMTPMQEEYVQPKADQQSKPDTGRDVQASGGETSGDQPEGKPTGKKRAKKATPVVSAEENEDAQ